MPNQFFPRDLKFWSYHICAVVLLVGSQIVLTALFSTKKDLLGYEVLSFSVWITTFTLMVLVYRSRYKLYSWSELPTPTAFLKSALLLSVLAMVVVIAMVVICLPIYGDDLLLERQRVEPDLTTSRFFLMFVVGNWVSTAIFLFSWAFSYIAITSSRKAKKSMLDNLRLQNSLKEAQLSSLSNQLNPHFLFNSLNNIRFMIHENADQADEMITSLSNVLRYSLESSEHEKLPLREEIEIIRRYVDIVNIQFEDRLSFQMAIPESMHSVLVPPMLLQMLIENSVKHGLEQIQHGGEIRVSAQEDGGEITLEVVNDVPEAAQVNISNTGIGLKNIAQRLELLYAGRAKMDVSEQAGQFRVTIRLPKE